ncbi:hypothetical protein AJ78_07611 [Emergomyces pasteurianus Ep9510]|uniref:Uncharacterized protein n=1 Tax=Emergomyces pasteurianus Ep9510 TaxID=1447872 RepID=A0A1J9Q5Z3_9EURO|nr:hypothetical protein AJ78_07611 [Emergomyces pasteurianus Ep9510]
MATRRAAATKKGDDVSAQIVPSTQPAAKTKGGFPSKNKKTAGDSSYAGALAAISVNVVLIIYLIIAAREDTGESAEEKKEREGKSE